MTKYLISFPSDAMVVPAEGLQSVADAAHAVLQEAKDAGVWVFGGGIDERVHPVMVSGDGTVTAGKYPQTRRIEGGYSVLSRVRSRYRWSSPSTAFSALLEFGDIWMMRKMLLNLRDCVTAASG